MSKFGGTPVAQSRFGGTPVSESKFGGVVVEEEEGGESPEVMAEIEAEMAAQERPPERKAPFQLGGEGERGLYVYPDRIEIPDFEPPIPVGSESPAVFEDILNEEMMGKISADTHGWWDRFRAGEIGRTLLGPPEWEKAMAEEEGVDPQRAHAGLPGLVEQAQTLVRAMSPPEQLTTPLKELARHTTTGLPPQVSGPINAVTDLGIDMAGFVPMAKGLQGGRAVSAAFAADMALHYPDLLDEFDAARASGDKQAAWETGTALVLVPKLIKSAVMHAAKPGAPTEAAKRDIDERQKFNFPSEEFPSQVEIDAIVEAQAIRGGEPRTISIPDRIDKPALPPAPLPVIPKGPPSPTAPPSPTPPTPAPPSTPPRRRTGAPPPGTPPGTVPAPPTHPTPFRKPNRPLGEPYSEPMAEELRRVGGVTASRVADEALAISDVKKRLYGDLSDRVLQRAKDMAGYASRATTWVQGVRRVTPRAAVGRLHDALETHRTTGNWNHVQASYRPYLKALWDANLEIGRVAQLANPAFVATGHVQRILTPYGMDVLKRGTGRGSGPGPNRAWNEWTQGMATANGMSVRNVRRIFRALKANLDAPDMDAATVDTIAQDFRRLFPKTVTHIRPYLGWHEVVMSAPIPYLESAASRAAGAVAFRKHYPLGSGAVGAARRAVQAEVSTDRHMKSFDNLMLTLQGHTLDRPTSTFTAPDRPFGPVAATYRHATQPLRALMLSRNALTNIGETLSGGSQIFLGVWPAMKGAIQRGTLRRDMERAGMVSKIHRDWSWNPMKPGESTSRIAANTISRLTMQDFFNEFQEYGNAAAARVLTNEVRAGTIDPATRNKLIQCMRVAGIPKRRAIQAANGLAPQTLNQFETKAAEALSGGHQALGEKSRLGASKVFQEFFWFQNYAMNKARQVRSILNNIIEDVTDRDWRGVGSNVKLLGKHGLGTGISGGITIGLIMLLNEGLYGLGIKKKEAQDNWLGFMRDALLVGYAGPPALLNRMIEQGGSGMKDFAGDVAMFSAPVSVGDELFQAGTGAGRYEGLKPLEKVGEFLKSKTAIARPIERGLAVWGLAQDDPELDSAIRAFYRWKNDKFGRGGRPGKATDEEKEFRGKMRRAVEALKDGNEAKYDRIMEQVFNLENASKAGIMSSLDSRRILKDNHGKDLNLDDIDALRKRIGDAAVDRLENFDNMILSKQYKPIPVE